MKSWWGIAWPISLGVLIGLLVAGFILMVSSSPRGEAIRILPPPSPLPLSVYVSGAVAQPGVYNLPQGSRVQDAIRAAGEALPDADLGRSTWLPPWKTGTGWRCPLSARLDPLSPHRVFQGLLQGERRAGRSISTPPRKKRWRACLASARPWRGALSITGRPTGLLPVSRLSKM